MPRSVPALAVVMVGSVVALAGTARAQQSCSHAVVVALPGVTWEDVARTKPPNLLALARAGSVGSVSVRTNSARTSYASGFATLGAGARVDGGRTTGGPESAAARDDAVLAANVRAAGLGEMKDLARVAGYDAQPGALGEALGRTFPVIAIGNADPGMRPPVPAGLGRWTLLGAMDASARVDFSATGAELLAPAPGAPYGVRTDGRALRDAMTEAMAMSCSTLLIDPGDVTRADRAEVAGAVGSGRDRDAALGGADRVIGYLLRALDFRRDLLVVVSPTSPWALPETHLGVALARGPEYPAGTELESASTRRRGIVTLPDVAPTILAHHRVPRPAAMNGRPWFAVAPATADRIGFAVDLDRESVFVDGYKSRIATGFIVYQVLVYLVAVPLIARREREPGATGAGRWPMIVALAIVGFPISTYLAGIVQAHELGVVGLVALLVAIDGVLVAAVAWLPGPFDRLLALSGFSTAVFMIDLVLGARLQLNTVFGYSPIIAGRFAGAGNTGFAFMGAAGLITGALLVHRWPGNRLVLASTALLFAAIVVMDGAPQLGSDVGGVLALVPALAVTWMLLTGRRPTLRTLLIGVAGAILALGLFLAIDLARPPEARTHLARLWQDVSERGGRVLVETVERKARSNLRVFRSTIYTLFVPPALAVMAWLLRRPRGRWQRLARAYPRLRAGLVGGLVLGVLGFAVNDSGIVIPAVILSYLLPMALLTHLVMADEHAADPVPQDA